MKCPCIKCPLRGCGVYHDYCYKYKVYNKWRQVAATRRNMDTEARKAKIEACLRVRGKRK